MPSLSKRHRTPSLGRVFGVAQQTWALADDPKTSPPRTVILTSEQTASDAADFAREVAEQFAQHGFHKTSAAWWGAGEGEFSRFVVVRPKHKASVLQFAGLVAVGLAGGFLVGRASKGGKPAKRKARKAPADG